MDRNQFIALAKNQPTLWNSREARSNFKASNEKRYRSFSTPIGITRLDNKEFCGNLHEILDSVQPQTFEEWRDGYRHHVKNNLMSVENQAWIWHIAITAAGLNPTPAESYAYFIKRIIDETWDGKEAEDKALALVSSTLLEGEVVRHSTKEEDVTFAIDIIVEDLEGNALRGFQVKPPSFFANVSPNYPNPQFLKARESNAYRMGLFEKKFNAEAHFISKKDVSEGIWKPIEKTFFLSKN